MLQESIPKTERDPPRLANYTTVSVIGQGSFARVLLVKEKSSQRLFALKIIKKDKLDKETQLCNITTERNILKSVAHPFVVGFNGCFQSEKKLYFVLEYCAGGELYSLLSKRGRFSETIARFYASQVLLALEHLHEQDIVYRDLKPENIVLDHQGYIRITDFGLSKVGSQTTQDNKRVCGTLEYLAPECFACKGASKESDWWAFGNLIYEMVIGIPAFIGDDIKQIKQKVLESNPGFPSSFPPKLRNLIEGLLTKDPSTRLGSRGGASQIKSHPWFQDLDWQALLNKQYDSVFTPKLKHEADLSYFCPEFTSQTLESKSDGQKAAYLHFKDFSYDPKPKISAQELEDARQKPKTSQADP